jgi:hypothetical protein
MFDVKFHEKSLFKKTITRDIKVSPFYVVLNDTSEISFFRNT